MTMMVHSPSVFGFRNTDDIFADKRGFLLQSMQSHSYVM